jgi:Zn-dependent protease
MGLLSGLTAEFLVAWVILGFVALLLHELGHAVAFRRYGVDSSISFWLFGGFTIPNDQEAASRLSDRQMLVVAVSGPLVGIVIGGMMLALWPALDSADRSVRVLAFLWTFSCRLVASTVAAPWATLPGQCLGGPAERSRWPSASWPVSSSPRWP